MSVVVTPLGFTLAAAAVPLLPWTARARAWVLADDEGHMFSRGERHDAGVIRP